MTADGIDEAGDTDDADGPGTVDPDGDVGAVGGREVVDGGDQSAECDTGDQSDQRDENGPAVTDVPGATAFAWEGDVEDEDRERDGPVSPPVPDGDADAADPTAEPTARWTLDPERYLFGGETLVERVDVRRGWVVATRHRLLVFDPDASGRRFVTVDRPNVVDVGATGGGNRRIRAYALRAGLYAAVLLVGGVAARSMGLGSLFTASPDVGNTPGVGGLVSMLSLVGALVGLLVDLLLFGGVALGLVALALGGWYLRGRRPTLVVERAGEPDLEVDLPSAAVGREVVDGLERAFDEELAFGRESESGPTFRSGWG